MGCSGQQKLFIIAGPSGVGKTTVANGLLQGVGNGVLCRSITTTTRPPRPGEVDGRDYHFVSTSSFQKMVDQGMFLEYAHVHGLYDYGSSIADVMSIFSQKKHALLVIDVQGVEQVVQKQLPFSVIKIMIVPKSLEALRERLLKRGTDTEEEIRIRLENARWELSKIGLFEHVVTSGRPDEDLASMEAIFKKHILL